MHAGNVADQKISGDVVNFAAPPGSDPGGGVPRPGFFEELLMLSDLHEIEPDQHRDRRQKHERRHPFHAEPDGVVVAAHRSDSSC